MQAQRSCYYILCLDISSNNLIVMKNTLSLWWNIKCVQLDRNMEAPTSYIGESWSEAVEKNEAKLDDFFISYLEETALRTSLH